MNNQPHGIINLRIFVEVSTENEARNVAKRLSESLSVFGCHEICRLKPYWKIPKYFEFCIEISGSDISKDQMQEISFALGKNWTGVEESLVWDASNVQILIDPRVRWANLEYLEE